MIVRSDASEKWMNSLNSRGGARGRSGPAWVGIITDRVVEGNLVTEKVAIRVRGYSQLRVVESLTASVRHE